MQSTHPALAAAEETVDRLRLADEHRRQQFALEAVQAVLYEWHPKTGRLEWGPDAKRLFRTVHCPLPQIADDYQRLLDEEDRECLKGALAMVKGGCRSATFEIEYRLCGPGGEVQWVEDAATVLLDADGEIERVIGARRPITARKEREEYLLYIANYDELTGLLNRNRLIEQVRTVIEEIQQSQSSALFVIVGIDDLSVINSSYGFDVADEVIISIGQRLKAEMKKTDIVGRLSGNKFGLIIRDASRDQAGEICGTLLQTVSRSVVRTKAGPVSTTVSIGAVALPDHALSNHEAVSNAEDALAKAKAAGRGCFQVAERADQVHTERQRNIAVADHIVSALNERRVHLAYQAIVDATTHEPAFHESLLRLMHRDGHLASAGEFIPAAEKLGMIRLLDRRALELVVTELHQYGDLRLSMNVSAMTATDPTWADRMLGMLRENQAICPRLIVEITETMAINDLAASAKFVRTLRELGCLIAIDDFGAGYTSFKNLRALEVNMVKLDGMFVTKLDQKQDNQYFVRALIDLARNLGIMTVAEWVDRPEEIAILKEIGVDYLQGFYFSKPTLQPAWSTRRVG